MAIKMLLEKTSYTVTIFNNHHPNIGINIVGFVAWVKKERNAIAYQYHRHYYNGTYGVPPDNCINILHECSIYGTDWASSRRHKSSPMSMAIP
jgi:hypothetical protein